MNEKQTNQESLLLTAEQVAERLQISLRSLWRLLSAGMLIQPVRLGRSVRWRAEELREWVAGGCPKVARNEKGRKYDG